MRLAADGRRRARPGRFALGAAAAVIVLGSVGCTSADPGRKPVRPRTWRHHALALLVAVLTIGAVLAAAQTWLVRVYVVEGTSMQPSVEPGDHVLVDMVGPVRRGDVVVVVLDGTPSVKRVIGMSGDHVWCCARGTHAVVVDDGELAEPYLYPGDRPSTLAFDVVVPEDAYWVMGDHRSASHDSRIVSTVPASSVIGVVRNVRWDR